MIKMFKCDIKGCNDAFSTKYSLKRHMMIHTKKKDFVCGVCKKAFTLQ